MSAVEANIDSKDCCYHCGQAIAPHDHFEQTLGGAKRRFCCFACQSVCEAIHAAGLEGYYQRTPEGILLGPPPLPPKDIGIYDFEEVQQEFVQCDGNRREINLLVEGIHCAACVWLIEKTLQRQPAVESAGVNLATRRLHLTWDNSRAKLSDLIKALSAVGYSAVPYDAESAEGVIKKANRAMLFRLFFAGFTTTNMMLVAIALYSGAGDGPFRQFFHWLGLALATPTLLYSGFPFFKGAVGGIRGGRLTMDLPIVIGLLVTYSYSLYVTVTGSGEVYFDTVCNLIFVILIGRYLEGMFRHQAVSATKRLVELQPRVATVIRDGEEKILPIRGVQLGDQVLVKPGYTVPVDGVVLHGESRVDESMLTGESAPVHKIAGSSVSAGTVNANGMLVVEMRTELKDTALSKIIRLVEEAQASKAPIQRIADGIVPWFVFVTLLCASLSFWYWQGVDFELALMVATSVLIITCPCALGMATPMAIAVASGLGAKYGILIKNGLVLETLSRVNHFVFDKTGSLTEGKMSISEILLAGGDGRDSSEVLRVAAAVERYSEHSIAKCIVAEAEQRKLSFRNESVQGFSAVPGLGVQAKIEDQSVWMGNASWMARNGIELDADLDAAAADLERHGTSCVHLAIANRHVATFGLSDKLRPEAEALVQQLRQAGIALTLLSGDRRAVVEAVAEKLGGMTVIAEVLPQDKDRVIRELQEAGNIVAMVGDGVNDAPALIRADVGIALGSGTDVSIDSADIVLMDNKLDRVRQATLLSRRALRTIKQNIALSFVYNAIMVPLAMMGKVSPLLAATTMPISSLLVIGNAARIRKLFKE